MSPGWAALWRVSGGSTIRLRKVCRPSLKGVKSEGYSMFFSLPNGPRSRIATGSIEPAARDHGDPARSANWLSGENAARLPEGNARRQTGGFYCAASAGCCIRTAAAEDDEAGFCPVMSRPSVTTYGAQSTVFE